MFFLMRSSGGPLEGVELGLSSLPGQEAPDDCSHLCPAELAPLQPQVMEAWKVPRESDVGVVGGSVLRPSLPASVLPEGYDST